MQLFLFLFLEIVGVTTLFFLAQSSSFGDTMIQNISLVNGRTLTSTAELFQLGFFSLNDSSTKGYLGIWYCNLTPQEDTVVWIANRNQSVNRSMASFNLTSEGNLILFEEDRIVWSTGTISTVLNSARLQLLESGNLVLNDSNSILWQSFDHPSDSQTYLPGMKLGFDSRTNTSRRQVSWRSPEDPSPGDYLHVMRTDLAVKDFVILHGSAKTHRSGPWNGYEFVGDPVMATGAQPNSINYTFVSNQDETYFMPNYVASPTPVLSRMVFCYNGTFQRWHLDRSGKGEWQLLWSIPEDDCDEYNLCGRNSVCKRNYYTVTCHCLDGFIKIAENGSEAGCQREKPLNCSSNQFSKVPNVKVPDTENATVGENISLDDCKNLCLNNCSCVAYAVISGPYGCITWPSDLLDLRTFDNGGDDLYVRLAESSTKKHVWAAIAIPLLLGFFLLCCVGVLVWRKRNRASTRLILQLPNVKEGNSTYDDVSESRLITIDSEDSRLHNTDRGVGLFNTLGLLPSYDLCTIESATDNFSDGNKLGEGGFGVVYKGQLEDGQKIAVKKLSRNSSQGPNEFQNELSLIAKLQHRNLVRLLGCCIEGTERLIILEYMENKSLDTFIYDKTKSVLLNWQKRLEIIIGIAKGLLYLHQDSILRVIHRDLKPSNILLDKDMIPKISDFGIARIFEGDRALEDGTTRPIGTFGYMAPEYLLSGQFSFKSDIFSFGVIVLEILSDKRNRTFSQTNSNLNLLQHTYKLWKEGRSLEILNDAVDCSYPTIEILRCIRMALLCVQDNYEDRPTMAEVVMMLASDEQLQIPLKQPIITSTYSEGDYSTKEISITITGR